MEKKSKAIFFVLATLAILVLIAISVFMAENMWTYALCGLAIFIIIFGYGFKKKKQYRENDWL